MINNPFVSQMQDEFGVKELMSLVTDDPNFLNEYTLNSFVRHHVEFIHRLSFYTNILFQEVTTSKPGVQQANFSESLAEFVAVI